MLFPRAPIALLLSLPLLLAGCQSSSSNEEIVNDHDPKPIGDLVEKTRVPDTIGKLLNDLDLRIRAWTTLKMTAATAEDRAKARELEKIIAGAAHMRRADLIDQLQTGPLANRIVAASALGFTHDPEALSPLVACLDEKSPELVGNALLGLMMLGNTDTPLERVCDLLRNDGDPWVRTNAAQCLSSLVQAGAKADCALNAARLGLSDPEPGVRSHCALLLGTLVDVSSIQGLSDLLHDPVPLTASAAVSSLTWIGRHDDKSKGRIARELVAVLDKAKNPFRAHLLRGLTELSGISYGTEVEEWTEWANRLP